MNQNQIESRLVGCWGFTTVPMTKTEWVTPGDTAIPGMTSLKDGDLQHSSALAQSPKKIQNPTIRQKLIRFRTADREVMVAPGGLCNTG